MNMCPCMSEHASINIYPESILNLSYFGCADNIVPSNQPDITAILPGWYRNHMFLFALDHKVKAIWRSKSRPCHAEFQSQGGPKWFSRYLVNVDLRICHLINPKSYLLLLRNPSVWWFCQKQWIPRMSLLKKKWWDFERENTCTRRGPKKIRRTPNHPIGCSIILYNYKSSIFIHFNRIFYHKSSILGIHVWNPPRHPQTVRPFKTTVGAAMEPWLVSPKRPRTTWWIMRWGCVKKKRKRYEESFLAISVGFCSAIFFFGVVV